ncbi:hypothetical protein [Desulfomonile tiedjei]|uniref:Uncharacterized protein n=1 Tax=Desulfomonile tiedjei (strain ATCC 49306 / DSM 6799 / DCB-1) TaxID=706587 RepID=I4C3X7_DESTA|nr:hypothetical protein [Desulfomonile tiedjei]AFM24268.1 hypothetical protein Desti_1557 [Desulfomonile tiedjei DSM 6799]
MRYHLPRNVSHVYPIDRYGIHMILAGKDVPSHFCYSTPNGPAVFEQSQLNEFLPTNRSEALSGAASGIAYGSYLSAIEHFLAEHEADLAQALEKCLSGNSLFVEEVEIIAEKHGSDYHPARVNVLYADRKISFVVNVALSERGKQRLLGDFFVLRSLAGYIRPSFVPEAYFSGSTMIESADGPVFAEMFLAEWFDNFHEFHLKESDEGVPGLELWDFSQGCRMMSRVEEEEIYRQAAYILTWYYNPGSFEEIFPWHHASGDFVVRSDHSTIDVRLITVRQYASRLEIPEDARPDPLQPLLFFLANLTVRMRLDRFDGIGNVAFAGSHAVHACVRGFMDALQVKCAQGFCDPELIREFFRAVRELSPGDLAEIFSCVVGAYHEDAPDVPIILANLPDHILAVYFALQEIAAHPSA